MTAAAILPEPLVPPDIDLKGATWIQFRFEQLLTSEFWIKASDQVARISVDLWAQACKQVPAGSLPDDDAILAHFAGFGRYAVDRWQEIKSAVMQAWTLCSDGRWYHKTLCEATQLAAEGLRKSEGKREADRLRLEERRQELRQERHKGERRGASASDAERTARRMRTQQTAATASAGPAAGDPQREDTSPRHSGDVAATSPPLRKETLDLLPPSPQGGGAGDFNDFEDVWAAQDASDSAEAAARAFRRLAAAERRAAIDGAKAYLADCAAKGRKICNRATYLREKRWKGLAASMPAASTASMGMWIEAGSQQAIEWDWYKRHFAKGGRGLFTYESRERGRRRGAWVQSEWPPVRMSQAPELLLPIASTAASTSRRDIAATLEEAHPPRAGPAVA